MGRLALSSEISCYNCTGIRKVKKYFFTHFFNMDITITAKPSTQAPTDPTRAGGIYFALGPLVLGLALAMYMLFVSISLALGS